MTSERTSRLLASSPVSTLAPAPQGTGGGEPAPSPGSIAAISLTRDGIAGLVVATALVALAFLTSSSSDQTVTGPNTWTEITLTFLGAGACAAAVLVGHRGPAWGAPAVALFAAFTMFAALSIVWSVQPDWSWFGANQLLSYLSVFAGAVALGRLAPARWPALAGGLATAMAALCAWSLLAKVFPATLASANTYGRLQAPFGYWNALGLSAALGLGPALWAGTRRHSGFVLRGLAVPAMTLMISVIVLSYSRSAAFVAVVAIAGWVGFVPLRLRSALMLGIAGVAALVVIVVALSSHGVTGDGVAAAAQDAAGHSFGLVAAGILVLAALAGLAASRLMDRVDVGEAARRRVGTVLLAGVALIPVAAVVGLALSSRGLSGEISHGWSSLTSSSSVVFNDASRLGQLGSSRPLYWREGLDVGSHALLKGVGELGYGIARLRYTTSIAKADQAHSYLVQTFADLGIVGLLLTVALLGAWCRAAARSLAIGGRWHTLESGPAAERAGLVALAVVVVAFGIGSSLDYIFYFPGVTIPALVCAGWLAGRGPLAARVGRRAGARPSVLQRPGAGALVTALLGVALLGAWVLWQPLRSAQALADAENRPAGAFASARTAASRDPLSLEPLYLLSVLYEQAKQPTAARAQLLKAADLQPDNPLPWLWLGQLDITNGRLPEALGAAGQVMVLNQPVDATRLAARGIILQARADLARRQAAAARARSRKRRRSRAGNRGGSQAARPRRSR
jgi:hypothetical protein